MGPLYDLHYRYFPLRFEEREKKKEKRRREKGEKRRKKRGEKITHLK